MVFPLIRGYFFLLIYVLQQNGIIQIIILKQAQKNKFLNIIYEKRHLPGTKLLNRLKVILKKC